MTSDQLAEDITKSLLVGIGNTDVRAGIIGEVGTSFPLHPFERESLVAAAKAQRQTGASVSVPPDVWAHGHLGILEILENAGADLGRVVVSHMDELIDTEWHRRVAERGVYLSFDTFGSEFDFDGVLEPRDSDRIKCLIDLLDVGLCDRIVLSQDTCYRIQLRKHGGHGYGHILTNIVPTLRDRGVSQDEITKMLVENPIRLLAMPC
jgi:phosphotriesterase-related protein